MLIRPALDDDLPAVKAIYDHQVRTSISTFYVVHRAWTTGNSDWTARNTATASW